MPGASGGIIRTPAPPQPRYHAPAIATLAATGTRARASAARARRFVPDGSCATARRRDGACAAPRPGGSELQRPRSPHAPAAAAVRAPCPSTASQPHDPTAAALPARDLGPRRRSPRPCAPLDGGSAPALAPPPVRPQQAVP